MKPAGVSSSFLESVRAQAKREIEEERFRNAVEAEKQRIRQGNWWTRLIPFTITITRKR